MLQPSNTPKHTNSVQLERRVVIQASPLVIFEAVTDWEHQGNWMLGTTVEALSGNGHKVGAELKAFSGVGSLGFLDTMTITTWQPPYRCDVLHTGRLIRGSGEFIVEPMDEKHATFIWRENITIPLGAVGWCGWTLLRPFFLAGIDYSLRRLKRSLSAETPSRKAF